MRLNDIVNLNTLGKQQIHGACEFVLFQIVRHLKCGAKIKIVKRRKTLLVTNTRQKAMFPMIKIMNKADNKMFDIMMK